MEALKAPSRLEKQKMSDTNVKNMDQTSPCASLISRIRPSRLITSVVSVSFALALWSLPLRRQTLADEKDPAFGWKDDIWPIREQKAWDISTDFLHTRDLTYDVEEGTWLRLDVSPEGEIVFDMLGDLYCLPASALKSPETTRAYPILLGVPHDSDAHFSPDGKHLAFRSDAGLGVENIWIRPWTGCGPSALRSYPQDEGGVTLSQSIVDALSSQAEDEKHLYAGHGETTTQRHRRLVREGRSEARRVTNETYRWVSDPRFHPDGTKIIATKWYTSGRSLGAGEGWEYDISSAKFSSGDGTRRVGRSLPFGWSAGQYGNQQVGPEQFIWWGKDRLIYAKNVIDVNGAWEYSKDVHSGIYAIFSHNLTSGVTETLVDSVPGGATRPELSRDGRTLAFVRRVRDKEALVLKDLTSGTIRTIWYGLTYDLQGVSAPMGTYPSFAFTPGDESIVIWAAGSLWNVPLKLNNQGERVIADSPQKIKWKATIHKKIAETRYSETNIVAEDTKLEQRLHSFKDLSINHVGSRAVFQAAGITYIQDTSTLDNPAPVAVPILSVDSTYYAPSFVPHLSNLVVHARWSDTDFTTLEIADVDSGIAYELTGLPFGRYSRAVLCECQGSTRRIAVVRLGGDSMTGNVVATSGAGIYIGVVSLPQGGKNGETLAIRNLEFVSSEIPDRIRFTDGAKKLILHTSQRARVIDLSAGPDEFSKYKSHTIAQGRMSQELAIAPEVLSASRISTAANVTAAYVAFVDFFQVYLADGSNVHGTPVWSKPGSNATKGLARVSVDGGHDLAWSGDGKRLFWLLGPFLHSVEASKVSQCAGAIESDPQNFGIECVKHLLDIQEITVTYETDVARLSKEAQAVFDSQVSTPDDQDIGTHRINADLLVIANSTLVTMHTGMEDRDITQGGMLFIRGGIIETVGVGLPIPPGAKVIDAEGGIVVPGFVDAHAHWSGDYSVASSWEHRTFLAYGCTTMHNPSLDNVDSWAERGRVERGKMIGPRIFHTGTIIYGAGEPQYHQDIADDNEARSALVRIKAEGGPYSFSYKNYNLPSRASRQRLITQAKNLNMIVVPEGGMNWDWDLTYITDGMTTVEHTLPIPVLYDDVMTLFALSGTSNTPTHIVNYGGTFGEQFVWATNALPYDQKLREFVPHANLEVLSESTSRPIDSYQLFNTSASVYEMTKRGLNANIGAHGEPPLGLNYHAEMLFFQKGGMSSYQVLRSATRSGALSLGLFGSIGSLSPGKLADLVIYPAAVDVLADISVSQDIRYVVKAGRVWDATTMSEEWPVKGKKQTMPPYNAD